jgi:hypothetical protein
MSRTRRAKPSPGDIYELQTDKGRVYLQYVLCDPIYLHLVRVLPGFFVERPKCFDKLAQQEATYNFFTHLGLDDYVKAAHEPLPAYARSFPLMKVGSSDENGNGDWSLYDGKTEKHIGRLSAEQLKLPTASIYGPSLMANMISKGWRWEMDSWTLAMRLPYIHVDEGKSAGIAGQSPRSEFFLYFPTRKLAEEVSRELAKRGFTVEVHKKPALKDWSVVASLQGTGAQQSPAMIDRELNAIAKRFGGDYDGSGSSM